MTEAKTQPTAQSVQAHLSARATPQQRADCERLIDLLGRVTGAPPTMWGPSIVGFGRYTYRHASGRSGESCVTGFAVRGRSLVIYLVAEGANQNELLARLGKYRMGKACLYIGRLAEVDVQVLEALVRASVEEVRRRHRAQDDGG